MELNKVLRVFGALGLIAGILLYVKEPSFPTPDKLLIVLVFVGMIFGKSIEVLKRFVPFVALLMIYDAFRGVADYLNNNINYTFMADFDKLLAFGVLPTKWLQDHLWNGQVQWYDIGLYVFYMLHFVLPIALAVLVWVKRDRHYWQVVTAFAVLSFGGFLTYIVYPAAPPWLASDNGYIEKIDRVSSDVWYALGVQDFPSLYNKISPNPVAAVPSLHAAYSVLFCILIFNLFKKNRWKWIALIYPFSIMFGTVYMGEHYIFDALLGAVYAFGAHKMTPYVMRFFTGNYIRLTRYNLIKSLTKI